MDNPLRALHTSENQKQQNQGPSSDNLTEEQDIMLLRKHVEDFLSYPDSINTLQELLNQCTQDGSIDSLSCVRRLCESMYDDITFNMEFKIPAAWTLAFWKKAGLDELFDSTLNNPTNKNIAICILVLSTICAKFSDQNAAPFCDKKLLRTLKDDTENDPTIVEYARAKLIQLFISFDNEEKLLDAISIGFTWLTIQGSIATRELFVALSSRWMTISQPLLLEYEQLIQDCSCDESKFQDFFTNHPQFLHPMAVEIWPQPNLRGAKRPDFIVRLFDNSYLVVEIETPAKTLVTKKNNIAATTTHAVSQAVAYRRFIQDMSDAAKHFPGIDRLHCLVVIGLERCLTDAQRQTLENENVHRHSLRVVGFDWLADRARAVQKNLMRREIGIRQGRLR